MLSSDPLALSLSVSLQDSKLNLAGEKEKKKNRSTVFCSSDPTGEKGFLDKFISCGARSV